MGVYADMMDRLVVTVKSPDGAITARLVDRSRVELEFRAGTYDFYSEHEDTLERQLAGLGKLLWTGRRRAALAATSAALGIDVTGREKPASRQRREYLAACDAVTATGCSKGRWVEIATIGWSRWRVRLGRNVTLELSEAEFIAEVNTAVVELLADFRAQREVLLQRIYQRDR